MCANTAPMPCRPGASWIGFVRSPGRMRWATREDDTVWLCVCGRANRTSDDRCLRCRRDRAHTVKAYSFAAIDSTLGRKERILEEKTRETLRRSSERTVQQMKDCTEKAEKAEKAPAHGHHAAGVCRAAAGGGALGRALRALSLYAGDKLDRGALRRTRRLYALIDRYWPDEFGAAAAWTRRSRRSSTA